MVLSSTNEGTMSDDNGTYILETKDGYRVAQIHAAENLSRFPEYAVAAFRKAESIKSLLDAQTKAHYTEKEKPTEYGVHLIREYRNVTFQELIDGKAGLHNHHQVKLPLVHEGEAGPE
jgi:hypothetical protein